MMNDIAIKVQNLTKIYKLYEKPIDRLKESLSPFKEKYHNDFYALNDINFEIKKGETVGIIGKNGAGKSTLLKIITGVLTPTSGQVEVNGKISSLLELGAGFNPEYTGIENIYLQGAIMGKTKDEIDKALNNILDFADIGDFVKQPVKSYSSGMFARLAFAVAINVNPDILIIDEALSVGDAKFQRKCFAKFEELQKKNITILFVSHDLESIKSYTSKSIYIKEGRVVSNDKSENSVNLYLNDIFPKLQKEQSKAPMTNTALRSDDGEFTIPKGKELKNFGLGFANFDKITINGINGNRFSGGENATVNVYISWDSKEVVKICNSKSLEKNIIVGMYIENTKNDKIFAFNTYLSDMYISPTEQSYCKISFNLTMPKLAPGEYFLVPSIALGTHRVHTQLNWCDYYGIIYSEPANSVDFLGLVEFDYTCKGDK